MQISNVSTKTWNLTRLRRAGERAGNILARPESSWEGDSSNRLDCRPSSANKV